MPCLTGRKKIAYIHTSQFTLLQTLLALCYGIGATLRGRFGTTRVGFSGFDMKIHEYQAKEIFSGYGIPVPQGSVASSRQRGTRCHGALRWQGSDKGPGPRRWTR